MIKFDLHIHSLASKYEESEMSADRFLVSDKELPFS